MYTDLYGLFTIRWSGGNGKRNCWGANPCPFLTGGATELQIEQLIPLNSLVTFVFDILGAVNFHSSATRIWISPDPVSLHFEASDFLSTSGAYESGSLQRILKEVLESPKAWRLKKIPSGAIHRGDRKRGMKNMGTYGKMGGGNIGKWVRIWENWGNIWFPHDQFKGTYGKIYRKTMVFSTWNMGVSRKFSLWRIWMFNLLC